MPFKETKAPNIQNTPSIELFSLKNKVCVVTGGSSGIGLDVVEGYASAGAFVVIIYNSTPVKENIKLIKEKYNVEFDSFRCNLTDPKSIKQMIDYVVNKYNRIDVFVANAGIGWKYGGVIDTKDEDEVVKQWEDFMKLDFSSVHYCSHYVGQIFKKQGYGSLIITASMSASIVNYPQLQAPYNAAKAGVKQYAKSLAIEWASFGNVRVNTISPGYVDTKFVQKMDPKLREQWKHLIPLGRLADPKEIVGAYIYLGSDASSYCNGTDLIIDGGYTVV